MNSTLPTLQGLMSPAYTLLMVVVICGLGLVVSIILLIAKIMNRKVTDVPGIGKGMG